ncbi:MAG: cytochrome c3 family protein [Planctomycetota bacterium]
MIRNPYLPIVVGSLLIFMLVAGLAYVSPSPGALSVAHAQVRELAGAAGCAVCHHEAGIDHGCLSCHDEIKAQLRSGKGYHHFLAEQSDADCGDCHEEHRGESFELVNQNAWGAQTEGVFEHPHVAFGLEGVHDEAACKSCHRNRLSGPFTLPDFSGHPRASTFLGLTQECLDCHADVHTGGLTASCGECHGQEAFRPPVHFDHREHFPLLGAHSGLDCVACHRLPPADTPRAPLPFPFDDARGSTCKECHESPHHAPFEDSCETCHPVEESHWLTAASRISLEQHAQGGFPLTGPHARVACDQCHDPALPFAERHPDPTGSDYLRRPDTCQGCHEDVHRGQFQFRPGGCLGCHDAHRFEPPRYGIEAHAQVFALTGAHRAIACSECHPVDPKLDARRFVGTPQQCRGCHEDPHAGQFGERLAAGDCVSCHRDESDTFRIQPFDHLAFTGVAHRGAHTLASCDDCHIEVEFPNGQTARRFAGTSRECASCHTDVHRGQFRNYETCATCHISEWKWKYVQFDHNTQSSFPLEGAHARVPCSGCHMSVDLKDGGQVVQYKPLRKECGDCHEITKPLLGGG